MACPLGVRINRVTQYWTIDVNSSNNRKIIGRRIDFTQQRLWYRAEPESRKMADSRFETLNEEETAEILNNKESKDTQKDAKIEILLIFKFRMFELKFAPRIIICCQPLQFVTELNQVNFIFLKF